MIRDFCCRVGMVLGLGVGGCEFYERMVGDLAGEVWVDVLHLFSPYLWAFTVKNPPGIPCKKIRHFLRWADIRTAPTIIRTFVLF